MGPLDGKENFVPAKGLKDTWMRIQSPLEVRRTIVLQHGARTTVQRVAKFKTK